MSEHPIQGMMGTTMEKIREMVDSDTVIGDPITTASGVVIIPVSKVSFGFASGGSDLPAKTDKDLFGGAGGAGITIQPIAFLVINGTEVKMMQLSMNASTSNAIINLVPDVVDKVTGLFNKDKNGQTEE